MKRNTRLIHASLWLCALLANLPFFTFAASEDIVLRSALCSNPDPAEAGRKAATELKSALGAAPLQAVVVMDSYEDRETKTALLKGASEVFPKELIFGGASYGGFTQKGSVDVDGTVMLGIAGSGVKVETTLVEKMGAAGLTIEKNKDQLTQALNQAGQNLARQLPGLSGATLLLLISDAHSPKNQLLLDGVQSVAGKKLPITGGSVNKNVDQNWIYYKGEPHTDSAIGILLTMGVKIVQNGRQAKTNEAVIATAKEGAATALKSASSAPLAALAFNCGGRKGKLNRLEDELEAIQSSLGKEVPLFGTYCAGEYGPADISESQGDCTPCGRGWHVMFTILSR